MDASLLFFPPYAPRKVVVDSRVIERCKKEDSDAQNALYQSLAPRMLALCIRYMGSREQARDVLHDAFLTLFSRIGEFRSEGSFEGWARRIFSNYCIDALRKRGKMAMDSGDELQRIESGTGNALAAMEAQEIMAMVSLLPPLQRSVLNLFCIEGYSHREVAAILEITEENSRIILLRAKATLGALLRVEGYL